jgi:hypothetical protein
MQKTDRVYLSLHVKRGKEGLILAGSEICKAARLHSDGWVKTLILSQEPTRVKSGFLHNHDSVDEMVISERRISEMYSLLQEPSRNQ